MIFVFATRNKNKLAEIQLLIPNHIRMLSLHDVHCLEDIPETESTIEGNAAQKSFYVYQKYHHNCFADDTGLEIDALDGRPGVFSARYAGADNNANNNIAKVLEELKGVENRKARFKTIISLVIDGNESQFEGIINGEIIDQKRGNNGFGYDPIFIPEGHTLTFAEMDLSQKNQISHRAIAVNKLVEHLKKLTPKP
jgi:XTP/dITP diphosphohydrolase